MATNAPDNSTYRLTSTINFLEIPTITLRYASQDGDSNDEPRAPFARSPLDEYRGAGSLSLRRIRTLGVPSESGGAGAARDPTYANDRARSILREARDAIARILGEEHHLHEELCRLLRTV